MNRADTFSGDEERRMVEKGEGESGIEDPQVSRVCPERGRTERKETVEKRGRKTEWYRLGRQ